METSRSFLRSGRFWRTVFVAVAFVVLWQLRRVALQVLTLLLGSAALAFLALPLSRLYERRFGRGLAAALGMATLGISAVLFLWLTLPALLREMAVLAEALPSSLSTMNAWLQALSHRFAGILSGIDLKPPRLSGLLPDMSVLAECTRDLATGAAGLAGRASMMVILAWFLLSDRERLALRTELLLPARVRPMAVGMGCAVARELRLYLKAQLRIAFWVALTAAALLMALRVRSAPVLGIVIGLMNMIPYFGPFIGGLPAVLIALGDGVSKAGLTLAALCLVQQLDGSFISPRVMGAVTGLSPALVLVALYTGAELMGVTGMLFAVPTLIIFRTLFRVYVQRRENI